MSRCAVAAGVGGTALSAFAVGGWAMTALVVILAIMGLACVCWVLADQGRTDRLASLIFVSRTGALLDREDSADLIKWTGRSRPGPSARSPTSSG